MLYTSPRGLILPYLIFASHAPWTQISVLGNCPEKIFSHQKGLNIFDEAVLNQLNLVRLDVKVKKRREQILERIGRVLQQTSISIHS